MHANISIKNNSAIRKAAVIDWLIPLKKKISLNT